MAPRSCPAENARPAPVSTTQPMPSSAASASTCRRSATNIAGLRAFSFSGRLSVKVATPPSSRRSTRGSVMSRGHMPSAGTKPPSVAGSQHALGAARPSMLTARVRRSTMSEVHVSEPVAASAARVWEVLGDFGGVLKWGGTMLLSCTVEGSGVGAVRRLGLPGGMEIVERCEAYDAAGRSLSYAIVGKSPIPIRNYSSSVKVVEEGPNACRVEWRGTFEPDGVPEAEAQGMVRGIYTGGIAGARKLLGV